jgi:large subunit ribosomal protein L1
MAKSKDTNKEIQNTNDETTELAEIHQDHPEIDLPGEAVTSEVTPETGETAEEKSADIEAEETASDEHTTKAGKHSAKALRATEAEAERQRLKLERETAETNELDAPKPPKRATPNPLHQHGKKYRQAADQIEKGRHYDLASALELAIKTATTKFDSSVEIHVNLGVDPRQADQMVRSTVVLPHGTGKALRVAVFADGKDAETATAAGADLTGTAALLKDIESGKLNFDLLIATPAGMATLGKVAKILGPRGLMPNPKAGTVTPDVAKAVTEAKAGKVEFRIDKQAIIHQAVGKVSFDATKMSDNATAFLSAILKAKPAAAKGTYVKGIVVTTSMGPSIRVDAAQTISAISTSKRS